MLSEKVKRGSTTILVTGGGGFLGRYLVRELLDRYQDANIRTISRNGGDIQKLLTKCHSNRLVPIVGDIRDTDSVGYAIKGADIVIHLAAIKYIDLCEMCPIEAVAINVDGTRNVLDLFDGDTFIGMSTDKAAEATSCYGATKLIAEKLILDQAERWETKRYMVVRGGNIFGSTGSVIEKWKRQIKQNNEIDITDIGMTRFFINVKALVDFIVTIVESGENGNIYIPHHEVLALSDLAKAVIDLYGNQATKLNFVGARPGEKYHEVLLYDKESAVSSLVGNLSSSVPRLTVEEIKQWLMILEE